MVTEAERLESINRINILERGEEAVARGDVTQKQFDESFGPGAAAKTLADR